MPSGAQHRPQDDQIHVLHVDDDSSFLDLAASFLDREGIEVTTATSANDGLDVLASEDVDCVVSDYDMPGMDGIEFLEAVRDDDPDLPFVLFTGKGSEEIAADAISAGVTDYLQKDTSTDQYTVLANRVQNAVERRWSERALAERNRRLQTLIQNLPGMVYRCRNEREWPMELVTGEVESLTGYSTDELKEDGDVVWGEDVIHPDDQEHAWEVVQDALDASEPFELEYRIHTTDGDVRHMWERGRGVYENGALTALEGFITDVTERREYEQELEQTNARLEALFEQSPDMINVHDRDGRIVDANRRFCEKLGYTVEELRDMHVWDVDIDATPDGLAEMRADTDPGELQRFDATYQRKDGSTFPVEAHLARVDTTDEDSFLVFSRDITDAVARDRELEQMRGRSETIFEHAEDALFLVDVTETDDGEVAFEYAASNPRHADIIGVPPDDLLGRTPFEVFDDDLATRLEALYRECYTTRETVTHEAEVPFPSGDTAISIRLSPVVVDGEVVQVVGIGRDVTERRERERELRRERDRLDEFASIVSHDLRSPLSVAEGNAELAKETGDLDRLDAVMDAHDRMRTLIEDILTLAREGKTVTEYERVALGGVAQSCWGTAGHHDATLHVEADGTVSADESRLQQLFENLFRNAIEHGGENVTVTVGCLGDGFYVADDGPGISEDDREDVFESGVTTSADGTGFGLTIVREIADAHGWTVGITESEDDGARFEICGVDVV
jgi:PAS domain S-box-containing protein